MHIKRSSIELSSTGWLCYTTPLSLFYYLYQVDATLTNRTASRMDTNYCTYCVYISQILILFKNSEIPVWCSQTSQFPLTIIPLLPLNKHSNWTKLYFWIYRFRLSYVTYVYLKACLRESQAPGTALRSDQVERGTERYLMSRSLLWTWLKDLGRIKWKEKSSQLKIHT